MPKASFSYPDALVFKGMFEVLSKIVDEANIEITGEEMVMRATDPAQIAYIQIEVPSMAFTQFDVEEPGDFGLIVSTVNKVLKTAKRGYRLDLSVIYDEVKLQIVGALRKTYTFRAISVPKPELNVESLSFQAKATVLVEAVKNALKDIELVSDRVMLEQEGSEALRMRGGGETKYTLTMNRSSGAVIDISGNGKVVSSYNIDYLVNVLPLLKVSDTMTIEFMENGPLKMYIEIPTGGRVTFLLAPYLS